MSEVRSKPSNNRYREEYDRIFKKTDVLHEDPRCLNCTWNHIDSGCNVEYDEPTCKLNRKIQ